MRRVLLGLAFSILCAGCVRVPRPALFPEAVTSEDKSALLADLKLSDNSVGSFKGLARGVLQDGKERAIVRYIIIFKKPAKLRVEALPATGAYTLSVLAATESGVTLIDPVGERAYRSTDPSQAIKTALKIPVTPEELSSYLLGQIPSKYLDESLMARRSETGIQLIQGDFSAYWLLDPKTKRLKTVELRRSPHAAPTLIISYGEYVGEGSSSYPKEFTIDVPSESVHGTITFRSTEFNPELQDSTFLLEIPAGYAVYEGLNREE